MKKNKKISHICLQAAFWPAFIIIIFAVATSAVQLKMHIRNIVEKETKHHQLISQDISTALVPNLIINNTNAVKVILEHFKTKYELDDLKVQNHPETPQESKLIDFLKNQRISTSWGITGIQPAQSISIDSKIDKQTILMPFISTMLIILLFIVASIFMYQRIKKKLTSEIVLPLRHVILQNGQSDDWFINNSAATEIIELYQRTKAHIQVLHQQRDLIEESKVKQAKYDIAIQIAHDIRSPVLALETISSMFYNVADEAKAMLYNVTKRINQIANDILIAHQLKSPCSALDLGSILSNIFEEAKTTCNNKDIEFKIEIDKTTSHLFPLISEHQLSRILSNLINNSIESIVSKGMIKISAFKVDNNIHIQVTDTGCGISSENLSRIFEPGVSLNKQSTGLGLAYVKRIMDEINGGVTIESIKGVGTTVTLTISQ